MTNTQIAPLTHRVGPFQFAPPHWPHKDTLEELDEFIVVVGEDVDELVLVVVVVGMDDVVVVIVVVEVELVVVVIDDAVVLETLSVSVDKMLEANDEGDCVFVVDEADGKRHWE